MSKNFNVLFFLKKGKRCDEKSLPVYVRVTVDGKRVEWSVQRKCPPGVRWNRQSGRCAGTREDCKSLNAYLDAVQGNLYAIQKVYLLRGEPLSAEAVRARIHHRNDERRPTLLEVYRYHNDQFEKLVGTEFAYGTLKKFRSALTSLQAFLQWKFNKPDVHLNEINHQFLTEYEFFLKAIKKMQHNSAMTHLKKLKKIVRRCVASDWLEKDPFKSYKITTKETHRNFLLQEELETLMKKDLRLPRLDQVRDIFLFSCYTGLSYADVMALNSTHLGTGLDGAPWIFTNRVKTNTRSNIPLLPVAGAILKKYTSQPAVSMVDRLLPQLSNQRLNSYLKEITTLCGFRKELTFHCARHTFATTVTLNNGVPIETIGKMLGHRSLRTTQIYLKILDSKISQDMQLLKQRLNKAG